MNKQISELQFKVWKDPDLDEKFPVRYWKGKQMLRRISKGSPMKNAKYFVLREGVLPVNTIQILPYRHCTRKKKECSQNG